MIKKIILIACCLIGFTTITFASWNKSPMEILDNLKDEEIQNTALDNAVSTSSKWIKATLNAIKENSWGYLQWIAYFWLSIALVLIIYNWIRLIMAWLTGSDEMWKFKKRFVNLVIWVFVVTSWYLIIMFVVSIIWNLF